MLDKLTASIDFEAQSLALRGKRQAVLTSNITNADTPNYKAVDFDFGAALQSATAPMAGMQARNAGSGLATTHPAHISTAAAGASTEALLKFRNATSPSVDGNTVDLEYERGQFAENSIKYESAMRALGSEIKTLQTAITGGNNS